MSPACRGTPPRRLYVAAGVPIYVAEKCHDAVLLEHSRLAGVADRPGDNRDGGLTMYVYPFSKAEERFCRWVCAVIIAACTLTIAGLLASTI